MRIYIVEDDLSVINILEDIIEAQGLGEICGDCGGEPANLADVLRSKPDVVLVDFFMPVKDGVEFVKELRTVNTTIKCIMISQVSAKELISKCLQRRDRLLYQQADQSDRGPFRIKKCGTADHK
ncbi:MAG: response regulator [Pilosibacter sp.]